MTTANSSRHPLNDIALTTPEPSQTTDSDDPFGTAALRQVVLAAWGASPARFREDANAEESLAVVGYAGRVLVELASNAADAARQGGVPARIRVRLHCNELRVANTGAPLTAEGVAALSSLRASAKRENLDSVGHFGVGFTAVLSWSATPAVVSTTGAVRFDGAATAAEIGGIASPALDREVRLRDGQVPVLRLPWPVDSAADPPPAGYVTEVRLPLDAPTRADVERVLNDESTPEDLFWALPDMVEIDLPAWTVTRWIDEGGNTVIDDDLAPRRYRTAERTGRIPVDLLADRPVEERHRDGWRITWVLPLDDPTADPLSAALSGAGHQRPTTSTVGAPTPTDEQTSFPARLIGTFPVDDNRRRLAPGPLCDYLLEQAAGTYLDLVVAAEPLERWKLLPASGFPVGGIDATLRRAVLDRVEETALFTTAAGDPIIARDACLLPGLTAEGCALIGQAIPGLLPPYEASAAAVLRGLGVTTIGWADASSALAGIDRKADFWWRIYEAAATADRPPDVEDLADIPVPLTGGRRSLGVRGCLLPGPSGTASAGSSIPSQPLTGGQPAGAIDPELARRAGDVIPALRIIDPQAAHPLLVRLGARPADPDTLLADPGLVAAVEEMRHDLEDAEPDPDEVFDLATVVLDLLAAGGRPAAQLSLVLTDEEGQPWPAAELLIPGAPLARVLAPDADRPVVGAEFSDRYPVDVLVAAGVRRGFAVVPFSPGSGDHPELPEFDDWLDLPGERGDYGTALADLDLVDPDRWPLALELIAADRDARACLQVSATGLSYSGWWLSRHALIHGHPPSFWRLPEATALVGLYDRLPIPLDPQLARSIGVRHELLAAASDQPEDLLERLTDPGRPIPAGRVAAVTAAVVGSLDPQDEIDLPSGVRTIAGAVIDAAQACVLDQPWLTQVLPAGVLVPGGDDPGRVAGVLDLPLASDTLLASIEDGNEPSEDDTDVATAQRRLARAADAVGVDLADLEVMVRSNLTVVVEGGRRERVRWWGDGGRFWVDGSADAAGRAAAWAAGAWGARHRAVAAAGDDWPALSEAGLD